MTGAPFASAEVVFPEFSVHLEVIDPHNLEMRVSGGAYDGFRDTVGFAWHQIRHDIAVLSWRERNGSVVVHTIDMAERRTYCCVVAAEGMLMRLEGSFTAVVQSHHR